MRSRFKVEYDGSLGMNPTTVTASTGRHSYGKFNVETERLEEEDRDQRSKSVKEAKVIAAVSDKEMASALMKRPRE